MISEGSTSFAYLEIHKFFHNVSLVATECHCLQTAEKVTRFFADKEEKMIFKLSSTKIGFSIGNGCSGAGGGDERHR